MAARGAMSDFVFQWPAMLALLLALLPLEWLLRRARKKRETLMKELGGKVSTHRKLRDNLRLLACALLILSLARPGHSPVAESTSKTGRDVVFVLDVSRSMLAKDIIPSRLDVAKQAIRDALDTFGSERVGLVIYAGSASILCPLTYDYNFVRFMLDQASPRGVDFGGTTLQSAIEKCVDQVLMADREGLQDLVILTDGGDHGSQLPKIVELIESHEVDCLVIGLGNAQVGATIPILDEVGNPALLEEDGAVIYTRLEDEALKNFAALTPNAQYEPVGTRPFNLGQTYSTYASDKPVAAKSSETGTVVYQEAAIFFALPAMLILIFSECWGARGLQLGTAFVFISTLNPTGNLQAASPEFHHAFESAIKLFKTGNFEEAEAEFSSLYSNTDQQRAHPKELAAIQINRGLALLKLAEMQSDQAPTLALDYASTAQKAFLSAKRYEPSSQRAGLRLQNTYSFMQTLVQEIEAREKEEEALDAEIQKVIERLQNLQSAQAKLRDENQSKDVNRKRPKRGRNAPPLPPIEPPVDAAATSTAHTEEQLKLLVESKDIETAMQVLDEKLAVPPDVGMPDIETIFGEPLMLMQKVEYEQQNASERLQSWSSWPVARSAQGNAIRTIQEILDLLLGDSQQDSEESDEYEEYDEDYEYEDFEEYSESMSSSEMTEGDLASEAGMQELPVPNYSAEDILMEEQGNLQFRQQKRANANAGKVKKDY